MISLCDFHTELAEKPSSGRSFQSPKILPHNAFEKRERLMLLFELDTSHVSMVFLFPRSGSRVDKNRLPDENLKEVEVLSQFHSQLLYFFPKLAFCFALAISFSSQEKKLASF